MNVLDWPTSRLTSPKVVGKLLGIRANCFLLILEIKQISHRNGLSKTLSERLSLQRRNGRWTCLSFFLLIVTALLVIPFYRYGRAEWAGFRSRRLTDWCLGSVLMGQYISLLPWWLRQ